MKVNVSHDGERNDEPNKRINFAQASQAMLAQANQKPQAVLQLLQ